ncbi:MAG: magnesium and cobalt transport protein CorA [Porphyromonadaceae bacterium CG2_30_38_12]|nr:MAG: magnesium and cobalt transport protein CorA [Porphyromonadaceae bacterium CG2_30_38_12]
MAHFVKKNKNHIGLSPYALVFQGEKKTEKAVLNVLTFAPESLQESEILTPEELKAIQEETKISWLNISGIDNVKLMEVLAAVFSLNKLVLSDVMNPLLRPKMQDFDNYIFVNIKMLSENNIRITVDSLSLIIFNNVLISFQEQNGTCFEPIRERIRKSQHKIRRSGTDYLAFALLDVVIDNYIYVIGQLGERIENLEANMTNVLKVDFLDQVNFLKNNLNIIRKYIKPAKEMILNLAKLETDLIQPENKLHYKELIDNINEATELADSYREMLYDMMNIYHTSTSTKLNEIISVLTIISVIFIPITFIVGVYGTNFDNLPELHWKYGYFYMLGLMAAITGGMLWYFKHKKWF